MAENEDINNESDNNKTNSAAGEPIPLSGLYKNWFLDYASYVILERAVPDLADGLKPVQRRILHAMREMDDGRYNKVANITGQTMQYHPHGDASINDAIVGLGQKDLLIDTQGNWGDIRTGDSAAAARYIEARLSPFAKEVAYSPKVTEWQLSYDGRKREPVHLPMKFPLLLAQGAEGIAVGLATRILPHNFNELIKGSIDVLRGKKPELYPDFPTGGKADISNYNGGQRGGKVRVRCHIEPLDAKRLVIRELPFGVTTQSLIDSIIKASDAGKVKVKKLIDNTAKEVEIEVQLAPGQSAEVAIDALYAFTDCEVSLSPNTCVIIDEKPHFMPVTELLTLSTENTKSILKAELEIKQLELKERLLYASLEQIFIENRIYRHIEEAESWEEVLQIIEKELAPYADQFYREITEDDRVKLTEIKIKRISKYDSFKADKLLKELQAELEQTEHHLANLTDFAVDYFKKLKTKYGKDHERKTELTQFDTIAVKKVAAANTKLYVNRSEGFIGYGLKKDEFVCECSDIDDIIVFLSDGTCMVSKIAEKTFVGKDIIYTDVFYKGDERKVYNMIYRDGKTGITRGKRFQVLAVTRDRAYNFASSAKGSKVLYFTANPNGEAEIVKVSLTSASKARVKALDFDFSELDIKGRTSQGNIISKYPIRKVSLKQAGKSTLSAITIWYDAAVGRLNTDGVGANIGKFDNEDQILVIYRSGEYELTNYELTNRYEPSQVLLLERFDAATFVSAIYIDGESGNALVKQFQIETSTSNRKFLFITESKGSKLLAVTTADAAKVDIQHKVGRKAEKEQFELSTYAKLQGWRSLGTKLPFDKVTSAEIVPIASEAATDQQKLF